MPKPLDPPWAIARPAIGWQHCDAQFKLTATFTNFKGNLCHNDAVRQREMALSSCFSLIKLPHAT